MNGLTCSLFNTHGDATKAITALLAPSSDTGQLSVLVHERTHLDQMSAAATDIVANTGRGALVGSAIGAVLGGLVLAPLGVLDAGPIAATLLAAGGAGFYGALAGMLTGRDTRQPLVEMLEHSIRAGQILVTIDHSGNQFVQPIHIILVRHHALEIYEL